MLSRGRPQSTALSMSVDFGMCLPPQAKRLTVGWIQEPCQASNYTVQSGAWLVLRKNF